MNTVIEIPHDRPTIALAFQPTNTCQSRAVTAGKDGKFKIWILREHRTVGGRVLQLFIEWNIYKLLFLMCK